MQFAGRGILLDIEGTTSSISFVHDQMFPFARRELDEYLSAHWEDVELRETCRVIAADAGFGDFDRWCGELDATAAREKVRREVLRLMDGDVKATGLKRLQGLIWRAGFESGELRAHVYPDVPDALRSWRQAERDVRIYSSGSVQAQKLFFGHTEAGDLTSLFRGHYDTTIGGKKESASYRAIAREFGLTASEILFVSDVTEELDAAGEAGMCTALCVRPQNATVDTAHAHAEIRDFAEIDLFR
jgi:enolase-phosphatase E1